jgi:ABC-type Zn uptake system ZnuABC Zn-binding protein ZnuA
MTRARAVVLVLLTSVVVYGSAGAEPWTRSYINSLPDSAFTSIETTPDGKKVRHLPHHDRNGHVDLPHVRNGLSRLPQVDWVDPANAAKARAHLKAHLEDARRKRQDRQE